MNSYINLLYIFCKRYKSAYLVKLNKQLTILCTPEIAYTLVLQLRYSTLFKNFGLYAMYGLNIDNNTYLINLIFTNTQAQQLSICILTHNKVYSIQKLYSNSVWYEREVSEFLPVKFLSSSDTRNLLLPYTWKGVYPLKHKWVSNVNLTIKKYSNSEYTY